jgi:hypothetical protein
MIIQPSLTNIIGMLKIHDPNNGEVFVDKRNAICYENISISMAESLSDYTLSSGARAGYIYQMAFGNGGSSVDPTGVITYLPPNTVGQNVSLYNQTYQKVVDQNIPADTDPNNNNMQVLHTAGMVYSDILVTCLLDYGEPLGQQAYDNSTNFSGEYVFDELGLQTFEGLDSLNNPILRLITHVIFCPVQKALNRQIQIDYTVRIQTLTTITSS